ncbi:hypothetical protein QCA50_009256 [Cerrena zonata]|uniref:Uncharacterized protein n=1 Tax=Cerrena zonata TaxID=2478898 RepID=A0AAW0GCQ0_9APHY
MFNPAPNKILEKLIGFFSIVVIAAAAEEEEEEVEEEQVVMLLKNLDIPFPRGRSIQNDRNNRVQ